MFEIIELVAGLDVKLVRWLVSSAKRTADFSTSELFILWKIHKNNSIKISDLSREIGISPSTLTGILDRFERKGYIERKHDSKDRRSVLLCETAKLDELVENWKSAVGIEIGQFCSTLPEGCIEALKNDLKVLQEYLDKYGEDKKNGKTS